MYDIFFCLAPLRFVSFVAHNRRSNTWAMPQYGYGSAGALPLTDQEGNHPLLHHGPCCPHLEVGSEASPRRLQAHLRWMGLYRGSPPMYCNT